MQEPGKKRWELEERSEVQRYRLVESSSDALLTSGLRAVL